MPRPLPITPKGPRRRAVHRAVMLLACPRVSPVYELNAIHALIKPSERTKGKIQHVNGRQPWGADHEAALESACRTVRDRLAFAPEVLRGAQGDYCFAIPYTATQAEEAKALALVVSRSLPDHWLTMGRLLVNNGRFLRRRYGWQLRLVVASNIHLRKDIRAAMKGLL